jgi:hypothetical protein
MRSPASGDRSWFVPLKVLGVMASTLLVAAVAIGVAAAGPPGPSTKYYSMTIDPPTSVPQASPTTVGFKLSNSGDSTQTLGSANITVPDEFTVAPQAPEMLPLTSSDGKAWTATYRPSSGAIELRAASSSDAIAPGHSVTAPVTVTASCSATTQTWPTRAKQANNFSGPPGNDFRLVGDDPVVTVTAAAGGEATKLRFIGQPSRTQVSTNMAPAVTVEALDVCGARATGATGSVALTLNPNPSGAALSGTPQPLVNGVATFSALQVDKAGEGYKLVASSGLLTPDTSASFDVVTRLCTSSDPDPVCQASDPGGTVTVLTSRPRGNDSMTIDFGAIGAQIDCLTGFQTRGALTRIDPDYSTSDAIEITMRWSKEVAPGTGVANFVLCMSKDGTTYSVPPSCPRSGKLPKDENFCELKRNRNGVGELVISFLIKPQDPYVGLG